jgi:hypothetical protein
VPQLALAPGLASVKADPGILELIVMHLALVTRDCALTGQFSIETSAVAGGDAGDGYAMVTITPPALGRDLPALDEIVRQSTGELRFAIENQSVRLYLPTASAQAAESRS